MAIEAQVYPQNLELPISSQDYFSMANNFFFINNNTNNIDIDNNFFYDECGFNGLNSQQKIVQEQQFQQHEQQRLLLLQQRQQQQQQQQYMAHLQNSKRGNSFVNDSSFVHMQLSKKMKFPSTLSTPATTATAASTITNDSDNRFTTSLSLQLEKQRHEIDRYVELQNEWLKLALQEQSKQQVGAIIRKLEVKAVQLLKQKDDEIAEATKKTMELQEVVRKMEIENETWRRISAENEALVISLQNALEQVKEQLQQQQQQEEACSSSSSSSSSNNKSQIEEAGEKGGVIGGEGGETATVGFCKVCNSRSGSVLMLPCRHLCCCKVCDALLHACPVCKSPKMASIDALIS